MQAGVDDVRDAMGMEEQVLLTARLTKLHARGGSHEGIQIPFTDGEIGEVIFQIRGKDGKLKARA